MSGFDTSWLDLREPADRSARNADLLAKAIAAAMRFQPSICVDLGCGTGATLRAFGEAAPRIRWRLVDNDPALLEEAGNRLPEECDVQTFRADLADMPERILQGAGLVTASALFDLCSQGYVDRLGALLERTGTGLYAALNYDGTVEWEEPHPLDGEVLAAFNTHQRGDKGFGPALGPHSLPALCRCFEREGFTVRSAASSWRLDERHLALHQAFVAGMADAVGSMGRIAADAIEEWRRTRLAAAETTRCQVGHADLLALPV